MQIVEFPHPSLFKKCKKVTVFDVELKVLLDSMWETMTKAEGLGLAANQVELEYRMFTMLGTKNEKIYMVNPEIVQQSQSVLSIKESCLSAPGEKVNLFRPAWVKVAFQDEKGDPHSRVFDGIHSICVFHEMQHLDGESYLQHKTIPRQHRAFLAKKWGLPK